MIWKFDSAPSELRTLHEGSVSPNWIAFVPAALFGADLHKTILTQTGLAGISVREVNHGDVVYFGSSDPAEFLELVGSAHRSSRADMSS